LKTYWLSTKQIESFDKKINNLNLTIKRQNYFKLYTEGMVALSIVLNGFLFFIFGSIIYVTKTPIGIAVGIFLLVFYTIMAIIVLSKDTVSITFNDDTFTIKRVFTTKMYRYSQLSSIQLDYGLQAQAMRPSVTMYMKPYDSMFVYPNMSLESFFSAKYYLEKNTTNSSLSNYEIYMTLDKSTQEAIRAIVTLRGQYKEYFQL